MTKHSSNAAAFVDTTSQTQHGIVRHGNFANAANVSAEDQLAGYIFMCNSKTKPDCFIYRVFGLPSWRLMDVEKVRPNMSLFLFDFEAKLLQGMYVATSTGNLALEPHAFGGRFPAQVKFAIAKDCLPLPEAALKDVLKENYSGGNKFKQELNHEQVTKLISMFRTITVPWSTHSSLSIHNAAPSSSGVSTVASPSLRFAENQVALARNDKVTSWNFQSQPSYGQYDSANFHQTHAQTYHSGESGLYQQNTPNQHAYMVQKTCSAVVPQVTFGNPHYCSSVPSGSEHHQSYGALASYGSPQGIDCVPSHPSEQQSASYPSYYGQSGDQNPYMYCSTTRSTIVTYSYQVQRPYNSQQALSATTTDQGFNNVAADAPQIYSSYETTRTSGSANHGLPVSQLQFQG